MDFGTVLTGFSVCIALMFMQLKATCNSIQKPRTHSLHLQALRRLGNIEVLAATLIILTSSSEQWACPCCVLAGKRRGEWENVLSKESLFGLKVACSLTLPYVLPMSSFFAGWFCSTGKANLMSCVVRRVVTKKPTL